MPLVYLASPIDSAGQDLTDTRLKVRLALIKAGVSIYDPARAWAVNSSGIDAKTVNQLNDSALTSSDGVLAALWDVKTIGVPMEMQYAIDRNIPVGVIAHTAIRHHLALAKATRVFDDNEPGMAAAAAWCAALPSRSRPPAESRLCTLIARDPEYTKDLPLPSQAKPGDIGCDLVVSRGIVIQPRQWSPVPSDVSILAPLGFWYLIMGRSSSLVKRNLFVMPSVIDGGFTGRLYAMALNLTDEPTTIARGERIAQILPLPLTRVYFEEVPQLPSTDRGHTGFGSTGV